MYISDTIAAICTPLGEGGIGVIRISGDKARQIGEKIVKRKPDGGLQSHRFYYGSIIDPDDGEIVDEAMVVFMKAPRSYTREDIFEIQCHGGYLLVQKILHLVLRHGARLADPGEFTKRAFLNGRIDLIQAEAVIDIIRGKTESALSLAQLQREGILSREIDRIREVVLHALILVEAHLDFPEDEIGHDDSAGMRSAVDEALTAIQELMDSFEEGRSLREGVSVLITGKPNVGKSSLLNTLLREKRAIVNAIPGTTRDVIEEIISIKGLPVRMLDTAGICETEDLLEKEGVEMALGKISTADLVLFLLDVSRQLDGDDLRIAKEVEGKNFIVVLNKCDLPEKIDIPESFTVNRVLRISTKTGEGIDHLGQSIHDFFIHGRDVDRREYVALSNVRHRDALVKCAAALKCFMANEKAGTAREILAVDLREALQAIGEVTGKTTSEEVLERIFERFCIGK